MLKRHRRLRVGAPFVPAAFRRLCVETRGRNKAQPCRKAQPPSGGCVLKHKAWLFMISFFSQPPSGGCVLKHGNIEHFLQTHGPAAFRRLCVETPTETTALPPSSPAAFRRLCVETACARKIAHCSFQPPSGGCVLKLSAGAVFRAISNQPPSGGCVLKPPSPRSNPQSAASRLQAAVC